VITLVALVLFINVSAVSAASTTTVDTNSIVKSSDTVKNYVESKKAVPTTVTVANKKVTKEQYLYLLASSVTNINKKQTTKTVTVKTVAKAPKPSENVGTGTLSKSEYITLAGKITAFVNTNGRLPNFISTSKGKMNPDNLIYTYSKIVAFYKANNRLPNTVSVKPWNKSSGEGLYAPSASMQAKIDAIGYKEAIYKRAQGNSDPYVMEKIGWGDCYASSYWLYNHLSAAGVTVRIVDAIGGSYPLHRWVQINTGNGWVIWNYAKYNSKHVGATSSSYCVIKTFTA
jgi:ribosomal protein S8E